MFSKQNKKNNEIAFDATECHEKCMKQHGSTLKLDLVMGMVMLY